MSGAHISLEWKDDRAVRAGAGALLVIGGIAILSADWTLAPLVVYLVAFPLAWTAFAAAKSEAAARAIDATILHSPARLRALSVGELEVRVSNLGTTRPPMFRVDGQLRCGPFSLSTLTPHVVTRLDPGSAVRLRFGFSVRARAPLIIGPLRVIVEVPGSPLRAVATFTEIRRVAVSPAQYLLEPQVTELLVGRRRATGRWSAAPAASEEFIGARQYRPGDSPRSIHRVLSLKSPSYPYELFVREFQDPTRDDIAIILDTEKPQHNSEEELRSYRLEKAIAFSEALCRVLTAERQKVRFLCQTAPNKMTEIRLRPREADVSLGRLDALLSTVQLTGERATIQRALNAETARGSAVLFLTLRNADEGALLRRQTAVAVTPNLLATLTREVVWR